MKKIIAIVFVVSSISSLSYSAERYDTTAFRTVTKLCSSCHGTPFYMAKQADDEDWEFYFNTQARLEKIHKDKPKALENLKLGRFKQHKKRILKFFIENSKYSGAVNGCDANFCGTNH
jgi:hypothetical protein